MPITARQIDPTTWEIPISYKKGMNVPARIIATKKIYDDLDEGVFEQVTNVACLPGIQKYSFCMPDGHWGYGFPVGGVAAFDLKKGIISPGGIGFDINCGMRLIRTNLMVDEVKSKIKPLIDQLFRDIPTGTGKKGFGVDDQDLKKVSDKVLNGVLRMVMGGRRI